MPLLATPPAQREAVESAPIQDGGGGLSPLLRYLLPLAVGASLATIPMEKIDHPISWVGIGVLCAGIGAAYSVDRLIDPPPSASCVPSPRAPLILGVAFILALLILFSIGPISLFWNSLSLGVLSLAYPLLKKIPFLKNGIVALAWTWGLSFFPTASSSWEWIFLPSTPPLLLLIYAACILCDIKDLENDRKGAVHTLPLTFGIPGACRIAAALTSIGAVFAYRASIPQLLPTAALLLLFTFFPRYFREGDRGMNTVDALFLLPGVLYFFRL